MTRQDRLIRLFLMISMIMITLTGLLEPGWAQSPATIVAIAGTGIPGFSGDGGPATAAMLNTPVGVAVDGTGNVYIADYYNHRIRKVDSSGIITTVAGSGPTGPGSGGGFSGDRGPATAAYLSFPTGVAVDGGGNLYIADSGNQRIRRVTPGGVITTVAGDGVPGFAGDGRLATAASLNFPTSVIVDGAGDLYIADTANHRVRKVIQPFQALLTWTLPADTSRVIFYTVDSASVSILFQTKNATGHALMFESFGAAPPNYVRTAPPFQAPLLYFSMSTTHPDTDVFTARIAVQYTDARLAATRITDERSLTVVAFNPAISTWMLIPTTVDPAANTAMFTTNYLSTWALASVGPTGIDDSATSRRPPLTFTLDQNAPNPFNPETMIRFELPTPSRVTLRVYNLLGQEVATLIHEEVKPAGSYTVRWAGRNQDGEQLASGVYLYRLEADQFVKARKMILLR